MTDRRTPLNQLVKETQEFERKRNEAETCGATHVEAVLKTTRRSHAGTKTHVCELGKDHKGKCRCWDGFEFDKFHGE